MEHFWRIFIQPFYFGNVCTHHIYDKKLFFGCNTSLCNWLLDFLTQQPQAVRVSTGPLFAEGPMTHRDEMMGLMSVKGQGKMEVITSTVKAHGALSNFGHFSHPSIVRRLSDGNWRHKAPSCKTDPSTPVQGVWTSVMWNDISLLKSTNTSSRREKASGGTTEQWQSDNLVHDFTIFSSALFGGPKKPKYDNNLLFFPQVRLTKPEYSAGKRSVSLLICYLLLYLPRMLRLHVTCQQPGQCGAVMTQSVMAASSGRFTVSLFFFLSYLSVWLWSPVRIPAGVQGSDGGVGEWSEDGTE